jgi:hypothetical protein
MSILRDTFDFICVKLPDLKLIMLPYALTVLSIPEGFPWMIFSPSKAHLFTKSSSFSPKECHPCWCTSTETESATVKAINHKYNIPMVINNTF